MEILQFFFTNYKRVSEAFFQHVRGKLQTATDQLDLIGPGIELQLGVECLQLQLKSFKKSIKAKIQKQTELGLLKWGEQEKQSYLKKLVECQKVEDDLQGRYATLQQQIDDMRPNLPARV